MNYVLVAQLVRAIAFFGISSEVLKKRWVEGSNPSKRTNASPRHEKH